MNDNKYILSIDGGRARDRLYALQELEKQTCE
jgi:hypothetical protein